jgi:tol-pal system protein YbgF
MSSMPIAISPAARVARALAVLGGLAIPLLATPVVAQQVDVQALQQRVNRLESDLSILQRQVYTGAGGAAGAAASGNAQMPTSVAASLEERVSQLESQMQSLTGRIEEVGHKADVLKSQLDRLSKDMDFRLSALEKGGAGGAAAPGATPAPGAQSSATPAGAGGAGGAEAPPAPVKKLAGPGQVLPVGTAQQQYEYARALLIQQDYAGAEKAFSAFLNARQDDPLAGSAQYWLGETYYVRANYDQAAKTFAEGYQKYPKSPKAPDTLLKLGMSLIQLNRKKDACEVLSALQHRYPNAPANVKQAAQRERQRAGCG